tara:strand:+ start:971 stop:1663 length:693 start_codon:yes stop_codon:yes gene_type:complete
MASNAAELASLLSGDTFVVNNTTEKVGVGSTTPTEALTVVGVVSATSFFGDGSQLEGVASAGLGTAINSDVAGLDVIYYTDEVLTINDTVTVDVPSTAKIAYTQYAEVVVADSKDLIIADGDDFIPDVLGLSTEGVSPLTGAGGRIRADNFTNKAGNGAPTFGTGLNVTGELDVTSAINVGSAVTMNSTGVNVVGVVTATSFKGDGSSLSNLPASGLSSARVYTFNQLFS